MRKIFMCLLAMAGALLLPGGFATAYADECKSFPAIAVNFSQQMRAAAQKAPGGNCTGHNLSDPFWSTNSIRQRQWCDSVPDETVRKRTHEMYEAIKKCSYCNTYARTVTSAANENIKYGCGFKDDGDKRWTPDLAHHFTGCMAARQCEDCGCVLGSCQTCCDGTAGAIEPMLQPIASQVALAVAECRVEKGINTSSSALSVPKTIPPLQDTIKRPKHSSKPAKKCQSPTATKGCNTGGVATVKPAPKGSVTSGNDLAKPSGGSNTGAMDRLSGDGQIPTASSPGSKTGEGSRRVPASGGASAVAKPVVNTPAALQKADPTVDLGKCASCGKPPPAPTR